MRLIGEGSTFVECDGLMALCRRSGRTRRRGHVLCRPGQGVREASRKLGLKLFVGSVERRPHFLLFLLQAVRVCDGPFEMGPFVLGRAVCVALNAVPEAWMDHRDGSSSPRPSRISAG